jgi:hypothetical protein
VIPSSSDLVFVVLLLGLCTGPLSASLLGDGGTGWHIRTGQWILQQHAIPRVDVFSTTMRGKPWYAWEWLYDLLVGALHGWAGLNGVILFTAFVIGLTFAWTLRRMRAHGVHLPLAVVFLLLALCASTVHFLARPHVVSWLFTLVWFDSLEKFEADGRTRTLLWLLPLTVVWVNVHGGFLVGLLLVAIYLGSDGLRVVLPGAEPIRTRARARTRVLAMLAVAAGILSLLNPYGYRLYIHIDQYLSDHFLMHHIDEFRGPDFHTVAQLCFAGLILAAVATMAAARARLPLRHWMLLLFAIASGLEAVRNIPVSSLLIVLIAAPLFSEALRERVKNRQAAGAGACLHRLDAFGSRMTRLDESFQGHLWPGLVTLALVVLVLAGGAVGRSLAMSARFEEHRFPVRAVDFLVRDFDSRPVFTLDRWGGYVIYRFYPKTVTAVDDRHDLYRTQFLKEYLRIVRGEEGWDASLRRLDPGWVLVPPDLPLAKLLRQSAGWKTIYRDQTADLFRRELR